jgi:hypothetical protein
VYAVHKVPPRNARCDDYESEQKSDPSHETAKKMHEEGSQIKRQNDNLLRHFGTACGKTAKSKSRSGISDFCLKSDLKFALA